MRPHLRVSKPVAITLLLAAGAFAGAAGFIVNWQRTNPDPASLGVPLDALWTAQVKDLSGRPVNLAAYKGQPLVINFWASWCGPCIEEMPDFQRASQTDSGKRVKFIGIGIDYARNMQPFANKLGITYVLLESGAQGVDLVKALGNASGALPFTLILDRTGAPVTRKLGKLEYGELMSVLSGL